MSDSETDTLEIYSPEELSSEDLSPEELLELIKKEKKVPAATCIIETPPNIKELDKSDDMRLLVTFTSLYSTKLVYKAMPVWELNGKDVPAFLNMKSNSFVKIIEGLFMSSILHRESNVEQDVNEEFTFDEAHIENLKRLFKDKDFPTTILAQLDSVLIGVVNQLAALNKHGGWHGTRHIDAYVSYYFPEKPSMQLKLRTFYLNIDITTFNVFVKVGKRGRREEEKHKFAMKYFDRIFNIDADQMNNNRKFINKMIDKWTKDGRKEVEELLMPAIINV